MSGEKRKKNDREERAEMHGLLAKDLVQNFEQCLKDDVFPMAEMEGVFGIKLKGSPEIKKHSPFGV